MSEKKSMVEAPAPESVVTTPTPFELLDRAVTSGAQVEVLERLMALSERWQAAQARRAFSLALSELRLDMPRIVKSREVDFTTSRGRTHYRYEDLAEMIELLAPVMAQHGLSFRWRTDSTQPGFVSVTCIVEHQEGHREETTLSGPYDTSGNKNPIQAVGSVTMYLQRYTLKAAVGIAAAHDDDGRAGGTPIKDESQPRADGHRPGMATEKQRKMLWARASARAEALGMGGREEAESILRDVCGRHGITSSREVPIDLVDTLVGDIESYTIAQDGEEEVF